METSKKEEKKDKRKRIDPKAWAKKYLKDGWEFEHFAGFGDGKVILCDICGKRSSVRGELINEKWVYRCSMCRSKNLLPKKEEDTTETKS